MRTLWFIHGPATAEQQAHAGKFGLTIRDSAAYVPGDFIEHADAIMGDAPAAYVEAYGPAVIPVEQPEHSDSHVDGDDSGGGHTAPATAEQQAPQVSDEETASGNGPADAEPKKKPGRKAQG